MLGTKKKDESTELIKECKRRLKEWGIKPPPEDMLCFLLISYIDEKEDREQEKRIALIRKYQREWLKKPVRSTRTPLKGGGIVVYLRLKMEDEIKREERLYNMGPVHPFTAMVRYTSSARCEIAQLNDLQSSISFFL